MPITCKRTVTTVPSPRPTSEPFSRPSLGAGNRTRSRDNTVETTREVSLPNKHATVWLENPVHVAKLHRHFDDRVFLK